MLLDRDTRILVQGITGREASAMTEDMLAYGTRIVAGVTPGKGGQSVHGVPSTTQSQKRNKSTRAVPASSRFPRQAYWMRRLKRLRTASSCCLS